MEKEEALALEKTLRQGPLVANVADCRAHQISHLLLKAIISFLGCLFLYGLWVVELSVGWLFQAKR